MLADLRKIEVEILRIESLVHMEHVVQTRSLSAVSISSFGFDYLLQQMEWMQAYRAYDERPRHR